MTSDKSTAHSAKSRRQQDLLKPSGSGWTQRIQRAVFGIDTISILGSIVAALVLGALIVAFSDTNVQTALTYFFARPADAFAAIGQVFANFFASIFTGAIYNYHADTFIAQITPLTNTLTLSVPLILAGLSIAVAFKAGLFNIGAQGQIVIGAMAAGLVGFSLDLPAGLHLLVAFLAALLGGAFWGAIPGLLRAKLGAHEVVVTIMMNSIATYFLARQLQTELFIGEGNIGKSQTVKASAAFPKLFGENFTLHWGFVVALLVAALVWWLLERSTFGFELRAVGANPDAARTAGINVTRVLFLTMVVAGALSGLAASGPVLGTSKVLTDGVANNYGFDAITVALLGRSNPLGVVLAAILFGALAAGGATMQSAAGIPVDIVQVTQAIIVLLVAAAEFMKYSRAKKNAKSKAVKANRQTNLHPGTVSEA